jgi:RNA polymerase sigma factor (sigma-70 family)
VFDTPLGGVYECHLGTWWEGRSVSMTDDEIVERVRKGETRHFEELVRRYQDAVYGTALRFTRDAGAAEDLAQEVFLRAYRGLERFKGEAKVSTWLYRVAYNLCIDWTRSARRRKRGDVPIEDAGDLVDGRADVEAEYAKQEEQRRVRRIVDGLDEHYRATVMFLYYQKLSYEEIAEVMGVPVKTVETRLYRARKIIRRELEREERGGEG